MKVFISWSGESSGQVAKSLRSFLQDVNQQIDPWLSKTDLTAGARWSSELAKSLDETDFGIICLTQEALESPWILFEAGALSKSLASGRVCPYLINIQQAELTGPLSQFQSKPANRDGTFELLTAINESSEARKLPMDRLAKYFDRFWPELEAALLQATSTTSPIVISADPSKIREILFGSDCVPQLLDRLIRALTNSFEPQDLERVWRICDFPADEIAWQKPMRYIAWDTIDLMLMHGTFMSMLAAVVQDRKGRRGYPELKAILEELKEEAGKREAKRDSSQ